MNTTILKLEPAIALSENQFFTLCQQNPDLKIERSGQGELIIMPPTGGEAGRKNATLIARLVMWNETDNLGVVFDSSTCFRLPKGGDRSPDLSWLKKERWDSLTPEQQRKFPPLCPDFVLELLSPSDNLSFTQAKMQEYQANGVQLAWLLNPQDQQVKIYRLGCPVEILFRPRELSGENVLPNFVLNLAWFWL
ncbi:MAG: Uma2 family endonuclease [Woronichinia naegeliana WA131]|uniref:Uma2 family endonuclease n=1 Tax=Woronichinia naegeliana WA131 TaxID=2824559 RepID=A0A977KSD1_9CYAN|nr:MAG: Uma2 family endonuclease [Woronichinia naegeliana WA131]